MVKFKVFEKKFRWESNRLRGVSQQYLPYIEVNKRGSPHFILHQLKIQTMPQIFYQLLWIGCFRDAMSFATNSEKLSNPLHGAAGDLKKWNDNATAIISREAPPEIYIKKATNEDQQETSKGNKVHHKHKHNIKRTWNDEIRVGRTDKYLSATVKFVIFKNSI